MAQMFPIKISNVPNQDCPNVPNQDDPNVLNQDCHIYLIKTAQMFLIKMARMFLTKMARMVLIMMAQMLLFKMAHISSIYPHYGRSWSREGSGATPYNDASWERDRLCLVTDSKRHTDGPPGTGKVDHYGRSWSREGGQNLHYGRSWSRPAPSLWSILEQNPHYA